MIKALIKVGNEAFLKGLNRIEGEEETLRKNVVEFREWLKI